MLKSRHLRLHITHREKGEREIMLTWHAQVIKVAFTSLIRSVSRTSIAGFALFAFVYAREWARERQRERECGRVWCLFGIFWL